MENEEDTVNDEVEGIEALTLLLMEVIYDMKKINLDYDEEFKVLLEFDEEFKNNLKNINNEPI
jgi:uncharacterized protein (UPF0305 family)